MTEPVKSPTKPVPPEEPKTAAVQVPIPDPKLQKSQEQVDKETKDNLKLTEEQKKKAEILLKIQKVLDQYNGEESNIPITNNYWNLLNEYRAKP
jgi:hypothetical protein